MKIWKVVRKSRGNLVSAFVGREGYQHPFVATYEEGKETTAPVGRLFAFDSLNAATYWLHMQNGRSDLVLYEAETTKFYRLRRPIYQNQYFIQEYSKAWWANQLTLEVGKNNVAMPPTGTITCKSLTLLRPV